VSNIKIYNENDIEIDISTFEEFEQYLTNKYIEPSDIVLELGARYGSVSCTINNKLSNKFNQVSVEPDTRVYKALEKNKSINNCNFHIVNGFISNKKLDLTNIDSYDGYGATAIENNDSLIPSYSLEEIINKYKLQFNVLVADCEGCLCDFFKENPIFITNLRMIIFEADYREKCNYNKIINKLIQKKFTKLLEGHQNVWIR
jgi:FkbM family methyltransferase